MVVALHTVLPISVGDTENLSPAFHHHLDSGELLTGTPLFVEQTTSDLTLTNKQVNSVAYTDSKTGDTVAIGQAAQCTVSGGNAANSPYSILVTVTTDATAARTFNRILYLSWE